MLSLLFNLVIAVGILLLGVFSTARTSFGRKPANPGPFWFHVFLETPVFILPVVVVAPLVKDVWIFDDIPDGTYQLGIWSVCYGLVAYFMTVYAVDKTVTAVCGRFRSERCNASQTQVLMMILACCQVAALTALVMLVQRLPIFSVTSDDELGVARKTATIDFKGPSVLLSMISLYGLLGFLLVAVARKADRSRVLRWTVLSLSVACLAWSGERAPLVIGILSYWFVRWWHDGVRISLWRLAKIGVVAGAVAAGFYSLTTGAEGVAVAELFFVRTFLGQIQGLFQTLAVFTPDPKYFLGWIPFVGFFGDRPVFSRDLMIMIGGDSDTAGLMNSIFLGEAFGAGGWPMLLMSPFVVGTSVIVSLHLLRYFASRFGGREFGTCSVFLFLINASLTSGMAVFAAFRGLIFTGFIVSTILVPYVVLLGAGSRARDHRAPGVYPS